MADNFWDALEGKPSSEPSTSKAAPTEASPSQAAPAFVPAPIATNKKTSQPDSVVFKPDAVRTAERAAAAANVVKQNMPEPVAASPTEDFMDNILGLWQIPAAIAGAEVVRRGYKAFKEAGAPAQTKSILDSDIQFNRPAETDAIARPTTAAPAPTQTVMTAGGPVNLSEVPKEMRPMVERSAQVTQQKMTAAPIAPGATPAIAPSATPAIAPSATPAAATKTGVAPNEQAMFNWVRGQMKQRGFADLSDDAVRGFLKTFYGDAPIVPGSGAAPEGYGTKFAEWAKQNIAGPGVGMPREEMKALKARAAVAPPQEAKPTKGPESQKGSASMGGMANTALNAAGGLLLLDMFKKARETGDYSDFALGAIGQVLGNVASPAANVGYMLMQPNTLASGTLDSPEAQELMRRRNAGAGRGFVNPPQFR